MTLVALSTSILSPVAMPEAGARDTWAAEAAAASDVEFSPRPAAGTAVESLELLKLLSAVSPARLRRLAAAVASAAFSWRARRAAGMRCVRRRTPATTGEAPEIAPLVRATWLAATAPTFGDVRTTKPAAVALRAPSGPSAAVAAAASAMLSVGVVEFGTACGVAVLEYSGVTRGRCAYGVVAWPTN